MIYLYSVDDWLAGILNTVGPERYALGKRGIRDGSEDIRRMHVAFALIIKSLERAVELRCSTATRGR